jgi:RAB protein geranylgeranyltransferase component A
VVVKNTKRGGYTLLVLTVRFYIQSGNFLKAEYEKLKTRIINGLEKNKDNVTGNLKEKREVNKFLKMVSDYKAKIRHIKHKIIEEENSKN